MIATVFIIVYVPTLYYNERLCQHNLNYILLQMTCSTLINVPTHATALNVDMMLLKVLWSSI